LRLSVVIPCYRSQNFLSGVVQEMVRVLEERPSFDFEIILVNDGSDDGTFDVISGLCRDSRIKGIDLTRNFGQAAATMAGLAHSTGDVVVYSDDDGETPFHDLWGMMDALDESCDIVFAQMDNSQAGWTRRLGSKAADLMANSLLGKSKQVRMGSFWVGRRYVVNQVLLSKNPSPYIDGLLLKSSQRIVGFKTAGLRKRQNGKSGYKLRKRISLWMDGVTGFSIVPLKLASLLGGLLAFFGLALAVNAVVQWFLTPEIPPGYTSVFASVILFGGLNLLGIGLVGEYVGRLYLSSNGVPQYVTRKTINLEKVLAP
jgi:undecaprenyl-phosphate 4-deoxy-4-formamido-L-arabinose transferase